MNETTTEIQKQAGEWHNWQPSHREGSTEARDWPDFMAWCDVWAKWTERTVPIRKITAEHKDNESPLPDWYLRVYGGKR